VAEMGARHVGDIKELCRLVHPRYGVAEGGGPAALCRTTCVSEVKAAGFS